jgi:hypothetical protein
MASFYTEAWTRIINESKQPALDKFKNRNDLSSQQIVQTGKPSLDQILLVLDSLQKNWDSETAIILPQRILYVVSPATVEKNIKPIMIRRIKTKKEAIIEKAAPEKLIREAFEELRQKFNKNPETLMEDYAFINYKGITDKKTKNYLISDAIKGYLHAKNSGSLIVIKRYDTLENFIETKDYKSLDIHDKRTVFDVSRAIKRKEIEKIRNRKMLTDMPEKVRNIILTKQSERIAVQVPSIKIVGKYHNSIKFRKLPQQFPDEKYPELNNEFYATWTDFYAEPSCNCENKTWFINYVSPNQIRHCVHEISAYRAMIAQDWQNKQPTTFPNPFIAASPFFKPTKEAVDFYRKLKNHVFVKIGEEYIHLPKVYINTFLVKQHIRGKINLF